MNINFKLWLTLVIFLALAMVKVQAEPRLAYQNGLKCAACHVNPNGGGLRNDYGRNYGQSMLPASRLAQDLTKIAKLNDYISVGMDARFSVNVQNNDADQHQRSLDIDNSQAYLYLDLPDTGLSFYVDQQFAPGTSLNREAFVMYRFNNGDYLRAGRIFLPFGLRIEDDSSLVRQATGINFDNSDNGVSYSLDYQNATIDFVLANGTNQTGNDDNTFLYGSRAEFLLPHSRFGVSALYNDGDKNVQLYNLYGGLNFSDVTLLAEIDYIYTEKQQIAEQQSIEQFASLVELNYQWRKGLNLKLSAEYFDPDHAVAQDEQTRYGIMLECTPIANLQLRLGARIMQDIPQKAEHNSRQLFLQTHFYF